MVLKVGSTPATPVKRFIANAAEDTIIDLTKIIIDKDFHNKNHLSITLPTSQVLHIYPNIDTFEVYDVSAGIFTSDIEIEDQNREVAKDLEEVKEQKIQEGLLLKSNENARKLLRGITTPLGVEAEIKFVDFNEEPLQLNQGVINSK